MVEPVIIGDCQLFLGDCMEILPTLDGIGAILTDPPYGINMDDGDGWDFKAPNLDFLLKLNLPTIIWGGNYFVLPPSRGWLVWHKPDSVPSMADAELAWTSFDRNIKYIKQSIAATNAELVPHPTQKPLRVIKWCIEHLPAYDGYILDCYMGSGTTGVACAKMGRKFIGIEREPKYFDIACKRIEQAYREPDLFIAPPTKATQEVMDV